MLSVWEECGVLMLSVICAALCARLLLSVLCSYVFKYHACILYSVL